MLIGRDHEQLRLVRLLENARAGRSGVVAVTGEAGIGKSALLSYAEEQAAGMSVLRARGYSRRLTFRSPDCLSCYARRCP